MSRPCPDWPSSRRRTRSGAARAGFPVWAPVSHACPTEPFPCNVAAGVGLETVTVIAALVVTLPVDVRGHALHRIGTVGKRGRIPLSNPSEQRRRGGRDHLVAQCATCDLEGHRRNARGARRQCVENEGARLGGAGGRHDHRGTRRRAGRGGGRRSRQLGEGHHGRHRQHARCDGVDHADSADDASVASNIESHYPFPLGLSRTGTWRACSMFSHVTATGPIASSRSRHSV